MIPTIKGILNEQDYYRLKEVTMAKKKAKKKTKKKKTKKRKARK